MSELPDIIPPEHFLRKLKHGPLVWKILRDRLGVVGASDHSALMAVNLSESMGKIIERSPCQIINECLEALAAKGNDPKAVVDLMTKPEASRN